MGKYRKIEVRIWNDAKFRRLSDDGKLVFFLLLTHPALTSFGAMRATEQGLAAEIGWTTPKFAKAFREVLREALAEASPDDALIVLPNFLRYNPPQSPNVVKSWASQLDLIPECSLQVTYLEQVKAFLKALPKAFAEALPKAFPKAFRKPLPNQEQEQEQEQEEEKQPVRSIAHAEIANLLRLNEKFKTIKKTDQFADSLLSAYPWPDGVLLGELRKMAIWLLAHPKKRYKSFRRFIVSWLNKYETPPEPELRPAFTKKLADVPPGSPYHGMEPGQERTADDGWIYFLNANGKGNRHRPKGPFGPDWQDIPLKEVTA